MQQQPKPKTLFEKIWMTHVVSAIDDECDLIFIDRHILHEVSSPQAFSGLRLKNRTVAHPELTFATVDHIVSTAINRDDKTFLPGEALITALRKNCEAYHIKHFDIDDENQGIVHVISPELGIALPGTTIVCGDSHTCTLGGIGAVAWGIGTSDVEHVLATQTIKMRRPKSIKINYMGVPNSQITAKDVILHTIKQLGVTVGTGCAIEYSGHYIQNLSIEERLTICNLSIELGARIGLIAPDAITFNYLKQKKFSPKGELWDKAIIYWQSLYSDVNAIFHQEYDIDIHNLKPQITWGTSPEHVIGLHETIPDPQHFTSEQKRKHAEQAIHYIGLTPGEPIQGVKIDKVFIGSCTNSRISDLRLAANIVKGKKVAKNVRAIAVPGSMAVKRCAEQEGLAEVFKMAGFEWRMPGCSMCVSLNDDIVLAEERCVSTSNRNFEGRQGPRSRTHLASPVVAAAAAIAGYIIDPSLL